MKTPIVIIAIMLCFNVLSQAQTTPNRGQELKEQAQNSLSQKDYIKARYLFKKAYEVFAAREDYPQAIECGIKANGFYIRENFYKEGFELCRSMDQLVWAGEQKTKKTLYDLRFLITKERLQMYIALKNPAQAKLQRRISLDFKKRGAHTHQFIVTDTGTGIPAEQQETIFKPFTEVKDLTLGDALGLPICSLIATKMNGSLTLDNSYTKGSRFILELHG